MSAILTHVNVIRFIPYSAIMLLKVNAEAMRQVYQHENATVKCVFSV